MKAHGVFSPWAAPEAPADDAGPEVPRFGLPADAHDQPDGLLPTGSVVLEGRGLNLEVHVAVRRRGAAPDAALGRAVLGACLQALLAKVPAFAPCLARQGIFRAPPLGPVTTLRFDALALYARAGTLEPALGARMAIDRLALALRDCRGRDPAADATLTLHGVETVTRA